MNCIPVSMRLWQGSFGLSDLGALFSYHARRKVSSVVRQLWSLLYLYFELSNGVHCGASITADEQ